MSRLLEEDGYRVFSRDSPIGASAEIVHNDIDIVILELELSVMGGERFATLVRGNERLEHVKLVLVCADRARLLAAAAEVEADAAITRDEVASLLSLAVAGLCTPEGRAAGRLGLMVSGAQIVLPERGAWTIGRGEDCDLVLDDVDASRLHARLLLRPANVRIEDLDSKNGTAVNLNTIEGPTPVVVGDEIVIGQTHLLIFDPADEPWRAVTETHDDLVPPDE